MAKAKRKKTPSRNVDLESQREYEAIRELRRSRFRILVCVDGSDESYEGVRFAREICRSDDCDIILLYVRPIDQGLRSGGLQMRVARENMMEWGLELPGTQYLKRGLDMLVSEDELDNEWKAISSHTDIRGDPLGDNKIEYRNERGKSIVLKLKTAPDPASGILDQYELGPYNLIILGESSRWRGELRSMLRVGVAQKVTMLAPCSTMITREAADKDGFLICSDGSKHSNDSLRRIAVLAHLCDKPIALMGVAKTEEDRRKVEKRLASAEEALKKMKIKTHATVCEVGDPVERIIETGRDYALISVSDSGKSLLKRFFVGSVAFDVMGGASRSVLNVR